MCTDLAAWGITVPRGNPQKPWKVPDNFESPGEGSRARAEPSAVTCNVMSTHRDTSLSANLLLFPFRISETTPLVGLLLRAKCSVWCRPQSFPLWYILWQHRFTKLETEARRDLES